MDRRTFLVRAGAGVVALGLEPGAVAARLGGISPTVLVTADLESHVAVLDLVRGNVLERVPTAPGPRSIEAVDASTALVGHTEIGMVTVLVAAGGVGVRAELDAFDGPRYTAVHPRGRLAFVTDSAREEVVVVDVQEARVVSRARVPGPARHVSISRDGRTLWTVLGNAAPAVAELDTRDPRRPRLVRTITPPFLAHDVVFAPDGRTVWVTSGEERRVALYRGGRSPARVLVSGSAPQHVAFSREKVFVACGDDGTLRRHRPDGSFVREARVPVGSYNVCFDADRLVTPSLGRGTVTLVDRNGRVLRVRRVARAAHDACILLAR